MNRSKDRKMAKILVARPNLKKKRVIPPNHPDHPLYDLKDLVIDWKDMEGESDLTPTYILTKRSRGAEADRKYSHVRCSSRYNYELAYIHLMSDELLTEDGQFEYLPYLETKQMTFRERLERWKNYAEETSQEDERRTWIVNYEKILKEDPTKAEEMEKEMEKTLTIEENNIFRQMAVERGLAKVREDLKVSEEQEKKKEQFRLNRMTYDQRRREEKWKKERERKRLQHQMGQVKRNEKKSVTPEKKKENDAKLALDVAETIKTIKALTPKKMIAPMKIKQDPLNSLEMLSPPRMGHYSSLAPKQTEKLRAPQGYSYISGRSLKVEEPRDELARICASAELTVKDVLTKSPTLKRIASQEEICGFFYQNKLQQEVRPRVSSQISSGYSGAKRAVIANGKMAAVRATSFDKRSTGRSTEFNPSRDSSMVNQYSYANDNTNNYSNTMNTYSNNNIINYSDNNTNYTWNGSSSIQYHTSSPMDYTGVTMMSSPSENSNTSLTPPESTTNSSGMMPLPPIDTLVKHRSESFSTHISSYDECKTIIESGDLIERSPEDQSTPSTPSPLVAVTPTSYTQSGQVDNGNSSVCYTPPEEHNRMESNTFFAYNNNIEKMTFFNS